LQRFGWKVKSNWRDIKRSAGKSLPNLWTVAKLDVDWVGFTSPNRKARFWSV
jgi:hypothetical protein